jgi:hypothetical protein
VVTVTQLRLIRILPLLLLAAACVDDPTNTVREPDPQREPTPAPKVVGLYEVTLTGLSDGQPRSSVVAAPSGPAQTLTPSTTGLTMELLSSGRMTHGVRGQGGQRYFSFTYRLKNTTGAAFTNLTLLPVAHTSTTPGTPFISVVRADGTALDSATISRIVPSGAVAITDEGSLKSIQTDVLQVFEESEVAAITRPTGVTEIFPYGFVARNPATPASRTIPNAANPNDFGGAITFAFRHTLPAASADDPHTITFYLLAVEDSETRITESIEEGQDTVAVRMIHDRAAALGATTVTVLAGSSAPHPAVADYPGQRQICSVRTAGTAGSPVTHITEPGGYAKLLVLRPGESVNSCAPYFRTGTPGRPGWGLYFALTMKAMDLYGNHKTLAVDTVRMETASGVAPYSLGAVTPMSGGQATISVLYYAYGESTLRAVGRRTRALQPLNVAGITRVWTGAADTNPGNGANWDVGVYPSSLDTAYFPAGKPFYPVMQGNAPIGSLVLENGATFDLGPWTVTVNQDALAGSVGGFTSTTGQLIMAGTGGFMKGNLPRMQVTGTYSLTGPVSARARLELSGGRVRTQGHRLQTTSF